MRNQHPGTCYRCGKAVAVGDGHFEKITAKNRRPGESGKWRLQHASCAIKFRGTDTRALATKEQP
jgi:hypothetical protein